MSADHYDHLNDKYWQRKMDELKAEERREAMWRVIGMTAIALAIGPVVVEIVQSVRAEPMEYACEAKRMDHRRISFTTTVICVPRVLDTRNDTLTIQR